MKAIHNEEEEEKIPSQFKIFNLSSTLQLA